MPRDHFLNWQQDPHGNYLARVVFPEKARELTVEVDLVAEMSVINPFDFFLEPSAETYPFVYEPWLAKDLAPFLDPAPAGPRLCELLQRIDRRPRRTVDFLVDLNQRLSKEIRYVIRLEPGVQTPEETLTLGSGSCRDTGWLLVQVLRHLGLAARFVSGYLIQLAPDVKSLDGPSGRRRTSPTCTRGPRCTCPAPDGSASTRRRDCSPAKGTCRWRRRPIRSARRRSPAAWTSASRRSSTRCTSGAFTNRRA